LIPSFVYDIAVMGQAEGAMANVVLPKVRMFIPCVSVDLEPGKPRTIHSPLHTIRMLPGVSTNYLVDELWFYVVLTDGVGTFRLTVEMRGEEETVVRRSEVRTVVFAGGRQLDVQEFAVRMDQVPFARAGIYEFRLVANHAHLEDGGTALLRVLPG
jgi:hypothetical protein